MAEPLSVTIEEAEAGNRLDSVLSQRLDGLSRTRIKALILAKLGRLTRPLFGHDPTTWPH